MIELRTPQIYFYTVEPRLTTTSLLRPYFFDPNVKITELFYYYEDPVNAATLVLRPGFYGPTVVALTRFHCTLKALVSDHLGNSNQLS